MVSPESGVVSAVGPKSIADHETPFVFDCWYIAARSEELGRQLLSRRLLGIDVLLYRRLDGTTAAISNRCPHRSAPLSMGRLEGDDVVCGYHGFTFDGKGTCIRVPSQAEAPKGLAVAGYATVERGPFVWIWLGDQSRADENLIPAQEWPPESGFTYLDGYFPVKCNYLALHENVLDLTHVPFLHGEHNATLQFAQENGEISVTDLTVTIARSEFDRTAPPHYAASIGSTNKKVNRHSSSRFLSPAYHAAQTMIELRKPAAGERKQYFFHIIHAFTPETAHSSHYFWLNARDSSIDRPDVTELIRERSTKVYYEDVEILEAAELLRQQDTGFRGEVSVRADQAGIQARRIVARLALREAEAK
jgi:phenylpropionate dioxygenase-like ring-hydroxylating dioxygenase large terminal subunit